MARIIFEKKQSVKEANSDFKPITCNIQLKDGTYTIRASLASDFFKYYANYEGITYDEAKAYFSPVEEDEYVLYEAGKCILLFHIWRKDAILNAIDSLTYASEIGMKRVTFTDYYNFMSGSHNVSSMTSGYFSSIFNKEDPNTVVGTRQVKIDLTKAIVKQVEDFFKIEPGKYISLVKNYEPDFGTQTTFEDYARGYGVDAQEIKKQLVDVMYYALTENMTSDNLHNR